MTVLTNM